MTVSKKITPILLFFVALFFISFLDIVHASATPQNISLTLVDPSWETTCVLADKKFYTFRAVVYEPDGSTDINYVDIKLDYSVYPLGQNLTYRWIEGNNTFTEVWDPNNYASISGSSSSWDGGLFRWTLNFLIKFDWSYPDENLHTVRLYSLDEAELSDTDDYNNIYSVENDLVSSTPTVNDYRHDPGASLQVSGTLYYQGTSITPPNNIYSVKAQLDSYVGAQKGQNASILVNGQYSMSVTGESDISSHTYYIDFSFRTGTFQTSSVINDRLEAWFFNTDANPTRANVNSTVRLWVKLRYDYNNALFDNTKGTVKIGGFDASFFSGIGIDTDYWYVDVSQNTFSNISYGVPSSFVDNIYGLTTMTGNITKSIIWDALKVVNQQFDIVSNHLSFRLIYSYDNASVVNGKIYLTSFYAITNSSGWALFNLDSLSDFPWGQTIYGVKDSLTYNFQTQTISLQKIGGVVIQTEDGLTLSGSNFQGGQLSLTISGEGTKFVRLKGSKPYYVKIGTEICLEGIKWNYNTIAGYTEIIDSYSTKTILVSLIPLSPTDIGTSGETPKPKTVVEEVAEFVESTVFAVSNNYVGAIVFVLALIGFILSFYYEQETWCVILGIVTFYLLFDLIAVFILMPMQLFPTDLSFVQPFLWAPPPVALEMFGPLAVQQFIQVVMMGSFFAIAVATVYGVSQR